MTNTKGFYISEFREGSNTYQPAYVDVQIGSVLIKGIEIFLDDNENPQIKMPEQKVITRYGETEIEIVTISEELREEIVNELVDNYVDKLCPTPKYNISHHDSDNFVELFKPQIK